MSQTTFADVTAASGLDHQFSIVSPNSSDPARMGGGVAAADYDADGDIDVYLVGGDGSTNRLYRNDGANIFTDVSTGSGLDLSHLGSGPAFADIDGDGDLDAFVGAVEGDTYYLLRNSGSTFVNVTAGSGLAITADNTISAGFFDYDMDGDLDLILAHWGNDPEPDTGTLWRNDGNFVFTSTSVQSRIAEQLIESGGGLPSLFDFTFAPMLSDIDEDRDVDILFASDFRTSKIFLNEGDGTFTNITDRNVIIDRNGMGSAAGDYDNDGDMDWFVTSIFETPAGSDSNPGNRLYRNEGGGVFSDVTVTAGVANGGWGWGVCFEDFDNDGDLDIFHVNGWEQVDPRDAGGPNDYTADQVRYFESQGDGTFVEAALEARLNDTGQGRGVACFDSDRDGDLDIVITNNQQPKSVVFYRNDYSGANHYLVVRLAGNGVNTAAVGARVEVSDGTGTRIREIRAANHFVSQNPAEAHFGLGDSVTVDVTVLWPDGTVSNVAEVAADQTITLAQ